MGSKLFVGSLPWSIDDKGLFEIFSPFGSIREAKVITDRETGRSRGFGFVTFDNDADAARAMKEMDGATVGVRAINVNEAQQKPGGGGGGGPRGGGQRFEGGGGGGYGGGGGGRSDYSRGGGGGGGNRRGGGGRRGRDNDYDD